MTGSCSASNRYEGVWDMWLLGEHWDPGSEPASPSPPSASPQLRVCPAGSSAAALRAAFRCRAALATFSAWLGNTASWWALGKKKKLSKTLGLCYELEEYPPHHTTPAEAPVGDGNVETVLLGLWWALSFLLRSAFKMTHLNKFVKSVHWRMVC